MYHLIDFGIRWETDLALAASSSVTGYISKNQEKKTTTENYLYYCMPSGNNIWKELKNDLTTASDEIKTSFSSVRNEAVAMSFSVGER